MDQHWISTIGSCWSTATSDDRNKARLVKFRPRKTRYSILAF